MNGLTLHPMKEIRIIISGEHLSFATDLLDNVKATGYTIIHNISGKGHHGFHTAHPMFNEVESLVMLMAVVSPDRVDPILAGLKPLFDRYIGVMFVSEVAVSRLEYFSETSSNE
ncbi:MAG: P-II family nitrogen regulator [Deltaproteobacteria bacterium]|nr:P-II family nitrogen regulator [Deltaproteobacteria bacterium]MDZ4347266.1 P-II family nitrogen regulator [Candidatus Binatia bacterium]